MKNIIIKILLSAVGALALIICFSPYGYDDTLKKSIVVSEIEVAAPVQEVFNYLGTSENASEWSTFVEKIVPLNAAERADGELGSMRRCYGKDPKVQWDEEIMAVDLNNQRELSVTNAKGFPMYVKGLRTQQVYESLENGKSRVALTLYIDEASLSKLSQLKFYIGAYKIKRIFDANLINIKKHVESRSA